LLFKDRLNTRVNLAHKHIISSDLCPRCARLPEDSMHLFITCPLANRIWQRIGILPQTDDINELWDASLPHHLPKKAWSLVLMAL
uniref:Reverse transcriptase zinc-binding domain-containing protein n=1 Tax=Aegilops tauschii subsp. strangulata TaxID=200361 RepID=A0A453SRC9_AEGTS